MWSSRLRFLLSLLIFCQIVSCQKENPAVPDPAAAALDQVFVTAAQNPNMRCLIVARDQQIIRQQFFLVGTEAASHDVRSVTKSVMATLIGIAIDRGIIASESLAIGPFLQPIAPTMDSVKGAITLRQVLSMSTGIGGNDIPDVTEYNNWYYAPNQLLYTLQKPMIATPGAVFGYNTGASHLSSIILTRASGQTTLAFAHQHLFQPLGIADPAWDTDRQGFYNGGASIRLTPADMLKLGRLYLNRGMLDGVRVVSEQWIDKATTAQISTNGIEPFGPGYGYFWWTGSTGRHAYYFANGYGGQFIVVVPALRIIVVATNNWYNVPSATANAQWYGTLNLIINGILPVFE